VKAATYVLKGGATDYKGSWHVEGMSHERIIASGIYYYHTSDNIKGEGLMFRRRQTYDEVQSEEAREQNYGEPVGVLRYG
jgi:hypothetical protein